MMAELSPLLYVAAGLTIAMFWTKNMMLGFPGLIFWAIASGQAYTSSTTLWDVPYLVFFGCAGMAIFNAFAMYGLRERRDTIGDMSMEHESERYIDEKPEPKIEEPKEYSEDDGDTITIRRKKLRERAEARRTAEGRKELRDKSWRGLTK